MRYLPLSTADRSEVNATSTAPDRTASVAPAASTACNSNRASGWRSAHVRAHFAGVTPGTYPTVSEGSEDEATASGYR